MRTYVIPPDNQEKEKIIGGVLNINQFLWALLGLGIGGIIFVLTASFLGKFAIVLGILSMGVVLPFIFYTKNGLTLFQYIRLKKKFKNKTKHLPNVRKGVKL